MISWWQEQRHFRFQRCCCDGHQPSSPCSSPLSELWLVLSVLTQVFVVLVDPEIWEYLLLHLQTGLSVVEPSVPLQGTCPGACQPPPAVICLRSSTQQHMDTSTILPHSGVEGDSRMLTEVLFASLAMWQSRGLWDFPASWPPPGVPNENAQWPFAFDFS